MIEHLIKEFGVRGPGFVKRDASGFGHREIQGIGIRGQGFGNFGLMIFDFGLKDFSSPQSKIQNQKSPPGAV